MNTTIKIPAISYNKLSDAQDIIFALGKVENNYRFKINDPNNYLVKLMDEYQNQVTQAYAELRTRIDMWKKMLFKYYKMRAVNEKNGFIYEHTSYIFPYRVIEENNTLWVLEVDSDNDYKGGVIDHTYSIDEDWNYDIYLDEITEAEFRVHAMKRANHVIDRRLKRLEEEKLNNTKNNELD